MKIKKIDLINRLLEQKIITKEEFLILAEPNDKKVNSSFLTTKKIQINESYD
jgi:hypothetical protein